ncbi:MAG: outer membrane protein assembly factor [Gammaproteobacteria bacterium]|nr:outer membrane protein assembly factor [Gammaproteobacteria bacterium]
MLLVVSADSSRAAVEISGIDEALLENVREYVVDRPDCNADEETVRRYAEELPETVRPALEAFGYYEPDIAAEVQPSTDECWVVHAAIDEGPRISIEDVSVELSGEAEHDSLFHALFESFPLEPGDPLLHGPYQRFKDRVEVLARQRGYLEAEFTERLVEVYADRGTADITLTYDSGPRYRFGEVVFDADALSDEVLNDFLRFDEGDPYSAALVARLQRELTASQYFLEANVIADLDAAENGKIPVVVDIVADRARSYSVGVGYSTDDGPRLHFSYDNERRNRAGHQLHAEALLARVRQTATFDYRVPVGNPQTDWWSFRAGLGREEIDAGVSAAARLGVRRTQVRRYLTTTRFLDALFEQDEVADGGFSTQMLIPGMSWVRTYRDDLIRPREGHRVSLTASAGISSEVSLLQVDLAGKWVMATPWDARVLVRGRIGAIAEDGDFEDVPLSMRFFAGGDNSVRGYDYESLGPRNADGDLIGGNRLIEASVEYEHPVRENWSVAAFVDSGNAYLDSGFETRTGAGIGARWFSPIGPVRLDLAWPLDADDPVPELHLSLGPDL